MYWWNCCLTTFSTCWNLGGWPGTDLPRKAERATYMSSGSCGWKSKTRACPMGKSLSLDQETHKHAHMHKRLHQGEFCMTAYILKKLSSWKSWFVIIFPLYEEELFICGIIDSTLTSTIQQKHPLYNLMARFVYVTHLYNIQVGFWDIYGHKWLDYHG